MTIVLRPEAEADVQEARDWYEAQRPGLGKDFVEEVDRLFRRVERSPAYFPKLHGEVRRVLLRRFPYAVYFLSHAKRIVIIGVLHQRRAPSVWRKRQTL